MSHTPCVLVECVLWNALMNCFKMIKNCVQEVCAMHTVHQSRIVFYLVHKNGQLCNDQKSMQKIKCLGNEKKKNSNKASSKSKLDATW